MYHHGYVATFGVVEFIDLEIAGLLLLAFIAGGLLVAALAVDLWRSTYDKP